MPKHVIPPVGGRVMDLQNPTAKMSKSLDSPQGTVLLLDDPKDVERKVKRAVTDSDGEVPWDPEGKPGVSNLLSILGAATDEPPEDLAEPLRAVRAAQGRHAAEAVVEALRPIRERHAELSQGPRRRRRDPPASAPPRPGRSPSRPWPGSATAIGLA